MNSLAGSSKSDKHSITDQSDHDKAVGKYHLHGSEGEDLGAAMGVVGFAAALLCAVGIALAAWAIWG